MAYNGITPKDLDTNTPNGAVEYADILDDSIREVKTVLKNLYSLKVITTSTTLDGTYGYVIAISSSPFTITLPSIPSVTSNTTTKAYNIKNGSVGTVTISGSIWIGSTLTSNPTLSYGQGIDIWADSVNSQWHGVRF